MASGSAVSERLAAERSPRWTSTSARATLLSTSAWGAGRARASGLSECPGGVSEEGQPLPAATLHPVYSLVGAVCPTGLGVRSTPDCRSFLGFEPSCTEQLVALPTLSCRAAQALRPCVGTRRWRRVPPPGCARLGPCMPFQFGLSTRAGTEALFKLLQVATKCNSRTTVLSVDAIGAARGAAFRSPSLRLCCLSAVSIRQFYGAAGRYAWTEDAGADHEVLQAEGGSEAIPSCRHFVRSHSTPPWQMLRPPWSQVSPWYSVVAFLHDTYVACPRERVAPLYGALNDAL